MKNIEQYKERFYNLMESTMGDVRPLINESTLTKSEESFIKSKAEKFQQNSSSCWDSKKYPNLMKATSGSMDTLYGLVLIALGGSMDFFSFGFMVIPASLLMADGGMKSYDGVKKIYDANKDKISGELSNFMKCLGV